MTMRVQLAVPVKFPVPLHVVGARGGPCTMDCLMVPDICVVDVIEDGSRSVPLKRTTLFGYATETAAPACVTLSSGIENPLLSGAREIVPVQVPASDCIAGLI